LVRLDEKGLTILVARDTYYREKTDEMIGTAYRGSLPMFMNAFMKGRKLTPEEAETKTGSRVFVFRIPLSGEHTVKAVSGEYTDTMTIRRCKTPDPGYRFKEAGSVSNWFDEDTFRTDCFSVRDSYGVLPAHPEAGKLVQEIMNIVIASRGDVAKSANSNPNLQKMMAGMSFESLLKKAGDTIPQETAEELNRKLQQIKKN
ncbi:MAG: hypothetical protein IJ120_12200, partial [Solobacterium sp.]|nr:hypothetical protein [Solobacterium sp.]